MNSNDVHRTNPAGPAAGGPSAPEPGPSGSAPAGSGTGSADSGSGGTTAGGAPGTAAAGSGGTTAGAGPVGAAGRRGLAYAVCAAVIGGALAFYATGRTWVSHSVTRPAPLPPQVVHSTGRELAGWATASALVAMAGGLALLATRGRPRLVVAALIALAGVGVVVGGIRGLSDGSSVLWPAICGLVGLLVLAAGVLAMARSRTWSAMGARYDAPSARAKAAGPTGPDAPPAALWDALDRGDDPTEG